MRLVLIIALSSISFSSFAGEPVKPGDEITSKKFNNSTFTIGDIKTSLLAESEFQNLHGDCWVQMRGQNISGSDLDEATNGRLATLPNSSGRFLRDTGGNAPSLGSVQSDAIRNIYGRIESNYITSAPNNQNGALRSYIQQTTNRYAYSGGTYWGGAFDFDASRVVPTANENRPVNMAVNYFIKINHSCN